MALFGNSRDVSLMRHLNREIINDILSLEVDIYKISVTNTKSNIYGEASLKNYLAPVRLACLINKDEPSAEYDDFGKNTKQTIRFAFLRDDLVKANYYLEEGDIIHWNDIYWEVSAVIQNQFFLGKNPDTNKTIGTEYGWNISIIATGQMTSRTGVQLENTHTSTNKIEEYL